MSSLRIESDSRHVDTPSTIFENAPWHVEVYNAKNRY